MFYGCAQNSFTWTSLWCWSISTVLQLWFPHGVNAALGLDSLAVLYLPHAMRKWMFSNPSKVTVLERTKPDRFGMCLGKHSQAPLANCTFDDDSVPCSTDHPGLSVCVVLALCCFPRAQHRGVKDHGTFPAVLGG